MIKQIIAIPTYNRLQELTACLDCLSSADGLEDWQIIICDDHSTDYDITTLVKGFPIVCTVVRNQENLGCDANNVALMELCLSKNAQRIFILDSDMIVSPKILSFINTTFDRTDGVLGTYNSNLHAEASIVDDELMTKASVGGTATVWDATLLRNILNSFDGVATWDWQACAYMKAQNKHFYVARNSLAQHLGNNGINNGSFGQLDYGLNFQIENSAQAFALAHAHQHLMLTQNKYTPPIPKSAKRTLGPIQRLKKSLRKRFKLPR